MEQPRRFRSNHHRPSSPEVPAVREPPKGEFSLRKASVVSVNQFRSQDLEILWHRADKMRVCLKEREPLGTLRGAVVGLLFYQTSTRTYASFASAVQRLGGGIVPMQGVEFSSVSKGESFEDTVRAIEASSDAIVLRHPEKGSAARAAEVCRVPVINAGDGPGEHPTQALLDFYTIRCELKRTERLVVTFVGDLKYGRTVHSLARLLAPMGAHLLCVSPEDLRLPEGLRQELVAVGAKVEESVSFEQAMAETQVLYMTRVQRNMMQTEKERNQPDPYILTPDLLARARPAGEMIVMHPFPRNSEIATSCDPDPRAAYFRQMEYANPVRMALLDLVLGRVV